MGVDSAIRTLEELLGAARTARAGTPASAAMSSQWLNADAAVRYLGLPSRQALYQAIRRGQVPVHRLGRRLRFSRADLDRLLTNPNR